MKFRHKKGYENVTVNFVTGSGKTAKNNFVDFYNNVAEVEDAALIKIMEKDNRLEVVKEEENEEEEK